MGTRGGRGAEGHCSLLMRFPLAVSDAAGAHLLCCCASFRAIRFRCLARHVAFLKPLSQILCLSSERAEGAARAAAAAAAPAA